ncbi:hypothetical protein [Streptomyces sp. S.PB5]|uniref:hypothetical protein n=1 Tax=Streptomyces sp. S.PB5 TaxID=3020844 RepID=UPI0025B1DBCC|nr:hypothetical protein [Streptomyces sp. S.PB5]MDN3026272.1 hypothetical protein [Streptomyces sp. S.PB5]
MPRGRHRHSPPLHRLLPPSAIAGVSTVCALAPWVFSQAMVLRALAAAAAATAIVGAVVMRRWDAQAGKQVADLVRARASDEWRHEERVAELETDLEESRELRAKLEQRLRAKRTELAGLRNEHAALLRRYATAETERASALEGRRLLEIEATAPARALPPVPEAAVAEDAAAEETVEEAVAVAAPAEDEAAETDEGGEVDEAVDDESADDESETPAIFSPEGSKLFLRAKAALSRFDENGAVAPKGEAPGDAIPKDEASAGESSKSESSKGEVAEDPDKDGKAEAAPKDGGSPKKDGSPDGDGGPKGDGPAKNVPAQAGPVTAEVVSSGPESGSGHSGAEAVQEDEAQGQPVAVDGHTRAAALPMPAQSAKPAQQPSGHFVAPTAVAVAPATPVRRPAVEGGFDFFGTQKASAELEAVQNEDLADVVGQEALALHKAEAEAEFKPADAESRAIGQVIDLTAHDETEQIDMQGLRSAVS